MEDSEQDSLQEKHNPQTWRERCRAWHRWSGLAFAIYATALVTGTHLPNPEGLIPIETNDKWLHWCAYFGLAWLIATWRSLRHAVTFHTLLGLWLLLAAWGAVDELTQAIPGINRVCDIADWIADILGAACGFLLWHVTRRAWRE